MTSRGHQRSGGWRGLDCQLVSWAFGIAACLAWVMQLGPGANAKTPGTTYCYVGTCHRVLTIDETARQVGRVVAVVASHYDVPWRDPFNPSLYTSSGEVFRAEAADSAASPIYPDGTRLLVWEPVSGAAAVVRVNNAGPYYSERILDLSRGTAERLGLARRGVGLVEVMVLSAPSHEEASYVAGRIYHPVAGYLGKFASMIAAHQAWQASPDDQPAQRSQVASIGDEPPSGRIVIIPGRGWRARSGGKVVLLPVKHRRPLLIRVVAERRTAAARKPSANRR